MSLSGPDFFVVAVYLAAVLAAGALVSTRIKAFKDYFLAGGQLTTPLLVCTLVSSYYGLDVTFGTSESGFYYGIAAWWWYSFPYYFFIALAALVVAPRLRRYEGAMTLPDIAERHYGVPTRVLIAVACFFYSAPVHALAGIMTLLQYMGIPILWGMAIAISICAIYTALGGLWADALTDTVQFVLMCVSLAVAIPLAIHWVGGWQFLEYLPRDPATAESTFLQHHAGLNPWMLAAWALTGVTVLVEPAFYQRVFAASDKRAVPRALLIGIGLWASFDWGVTLLGMIARSAVEQGLLPSDLEGRESLLTLCMQVLPVGLRGLMVGGILAAAMSNVDTYSLLASGNLVYDIYRPLFNPHASDQRLLPMVRVGVVLVMIAAAAVSLWFERMRDMWQFLASIMAATALTPMMGALFARPKPAAGFAAAAAGLLGVSGFYGVLWNLGRFHPGEESHVLVVGPLELWQDYAVLCALPISLAGYAVGNFLGARRP